MERIAVGQPVYDRGFALWGSERCPGMVSVQLVRIPSSLFPSDRSVSRVGLVDCGHSRLFHLSDCSRLESLASRACHSRRLDPHRILVPGRNVRQRELVSADGTKHVHDAFG